MKIGFYDTEVKKSPEKVGWNNYKEMGLSVGCVVEKEITKKDDKIFVNSTTSQTFVDDAEGLADKLNEMDLVVGYNNNNFDDNLICEFAGGDHEFLINNFDIQKDLDTRTGIRYCTSLDSLARYTINKSKTDGMDGSQAPKLWQDYAQKNDGEALEKLKGYCMDDTKLTADVFLFGLKYGYVLIRPNKNESLFGNMALQVFTNWEDNINETS